MPEFIESCVGFYLFVGFVTAVCYHTDRSNRGEDATFETFLPDVFLWPAIVYKFFKNKL